MEEEGHIDFKALRAKFQEEALLVQCKTSRPAVAEKPKHLPPPGGHCSSMISSISTASENKTTVVPRVIFRDGLRASGGKRPISFPPQPQQNSFSPQFANGEGAATLALKDRHLPRVLPSLPVKEKKTALPVKNEHKQAPDPVKEVLPQTKIKKKGLLLPFKSSKASKLSTESAEEPTYAELTNRPYSAPGEMPSVENMTPEDEVSFKGDRQTTHFPLSSTDIPISPPPVETSFDCDNRIISTLEKARKKFSKRQMLISTKPKGLRSPDYTSREKAFPSPPKTIESPEPDLPIPPPVCLLPLACMSARPFFKASNTSHKEFPWDKQHGREKASMKPAEPHSHFDPPKKPLPDLRSLGPLPAKPPRPPSVDLCRYHPPSVNEVLPVTSQAPVEEPESDHPSISNAVLDAPEFPDFENPEMEAAEGEDVDIAVLELEALDFLGSELPDFEVSEFEDPQFDLCNSTEPTVSSGDQDLNLGSPNIIPLDPASFPEPIHLSGPTVGDEWSQSVDAVIDSLPNSHADESEVLVAECRSVPEESELNFHEAVNDESQPQLGASQQDYEACNNVYEDVEDIKQFILSQNLRKHKGSVKNPYVENLPMKEEAGRNIWPRNPWGSVTGEHTHNLLHSKERQSPNTADHKEQRKREKQRIEKEKKEQKEKDKKENEMKKKFKVTGEEEPMYHAKVMVASKVRKNDLPVQSGDTVSIIRTTNCPKGKWLARDANHKYGYISVMNVELNIKEMLELGKKAQAAGRGGTLEGDTISIGSRSSSHAVLTSSFTDDSEEWACEDETLSHSYESHSFTQQIASVPETSCGHAKAHHTLSDANLEDLHTHTRHEALQKLAVFFQHRKDESGDDPDSGGATPTNTEPPSKLPSFLCAVEEPPYPELEVDFTELELLPPPPLYADTL